MAVDLQELKQHEGKDLNLRINESGAVEEVTANLTGALPQGVVIYIKRRGPKLLTLEQIEGFTVPEVKPKEPKPRSMKLIDDEDIGQHLLDKHGATIEYVMQTPVEQMVEFHENVHAQHRLGHFHQAKSQTDAEKAVSDIEGSQDSSNESGDEEGDKSDEESDKSESAA